MIDWKKYDPENPPEHRKAYLVTNGKRVISAYLDSDEVNGQQCSKNFLTVLCVMCYIKRVTKNEGRNAQ